MAISAMAAIVPPGLPSGYRRGHLAVPIGSGPATHAIYVANELSNNVSVIDGTTNTVTAAVAPSS